jgi:hypothetical protein
LLAEKDLSLQKTGGMYFGAPYKQGMIELDCNFWYEDKLSALSLYGSYACSDNLTLKLEIPAAFTSLILSGFKAIGLFDMGRYCVDALAAVVNIEGNAGILQRYPYKVAIRLIF